MSRLYRRSRRGRGMSLTAAMLILAALAVVGVVVDLAEHLAVLVPIPAAVVVAFAAGRRYERRRARGRARIEQPTAPTGHEVRQPDPADQLAQLEQLAGRPIEAILATYQRVARYHGGPR
jgi:hypothetical protein